jgi:hypothetical protein
VNGTNVGGSVPRLASPRSARQHPPAEVIEACAWEPPGDLRRQPLVGSCPGPCTGRSTTRRAGRLASRPAGLLRQRSIRHGWHHQLPPRPHPSTTGQVVNGLPHVLATRAVAGRRQDRSSGVGGRPGGSRGCCRRRRPLIDRRGARERPSHDARQSPWRSGAPRRAGAKWKGGSDSQSKEVDDT